MGFWKMIFKPHDGSRQRVKDAVEESRQKREAANSRFEDTVRELLDANDRITGRKVNEPRTQ